MMRTCTLFLQSLLVSGIRDSISAAICRLLIISFLCLCQPVFAQQPGVISPPEGCDTAQVDAWLKRSRQVIETHDDSVYYYLNRAVQQSYRCLFTSRLIHSLTELAAWYFGHDVDQAIHYAHLALQEFENRPVKNMPVPNAVYKAYNVLAKSFETQGRIDSSAYYYYLLNDVIEKGTITDAEYAVSVYSQLALFWLNSNWDINAGYIEPTQYFINKATQAEKRLKDSSVQAYTSYMLKGAYYFCTRNYDSSRYYYLEFLQQRQRIGRSNATWEAAINLNVSETYLAEKRTPEAMRYIQQTLDLRHKLAGNPRYLMLANLYLSKAYYLQRNYTNSLAAFELALNEVKKNDVLGKEVIEAYKIAGDAYEALGMGGKAMEYKNTYIQLHDSLMKKDKLDMMNKLQIKFRVAEKDKELAEQQLIIAEGEASVRKRNSWIAGISMLTVFILVLFILWQRANRHKQHLQQEEINNFRQKMEIANLQAKIEGEERERTRIARELHDGIGGLLSAAKMNFELVKATYHLHNKQDYLDGLSLLTEAATELRKTAHNMMPEILLQEGLVEAAGHFCQTVTRNSSVRIHFQTAGMVQKFAPGFELAIYRVVQELVHNILKHAHATEALIQMNFNDDIFDVSIEDNGVGVPENILAKTKGMGLKSIEDRLKAIHGTMAIQNLPGGGTGVYLEVSLLKENIVSQS
jgi:two-component system NarL family sensor kinase